MPTGLFALFWGAVESLVLGLPYAPDTVKRKHRSEAEAQFSAQKVTDQAGNVVFEGALAQVLKADESYRTSNGRVLDYVLTVFAVSQADRYFLFKSNSSGRPYLNELSPERAQLVLRGHFRPYSKRDA